MLRTSSPFQRVRSTFRRHLRPSTLCASFSSLLLLTSCGGEDPSAGPGALALHVLPGLSSGTMNDYFSLPFPNDLRLKTQPAPTAPVGESELRSGYDLTQFPQPAGQPGKYVAFLNGKIPGAGPGAAIYFRFDAPLDTTTLPAAERSTDDDSTAFVVDVTEGSPTYLKRTPILATFHREGNRYIGDNWVSLRPVPGLPLRERTTYIAVLTKGVHADAGGEIRPDIPLLAMMSVTQPMNEPYRSAWPRYAPLRNWIAATGLRDKVGAATVFTTQDATSMMGKLRQAVYDQTAVPTPKAVTYLRSHDGMADLYTGTFASPNFQSGTPPYWSEGGGLDLDARGIPKVVRTENLRFALSIPNAEMPPDGWPVILYAHGTGGDYQTFIREQLDLRASLIEQAGRPPVRMAMIGIDQVLHGPRDPSSSNPEITFFNLQNLEAARENVKQGAVDDFQLLRLVEGMDIPKAPTTGRPIRFDKKRIYFMGHSQGGLTGPLFLAAEPKVPAGILSGAGSVLILSLLNKTEPNNIAELVESLLQEPPLVDHPLLNLLQAYFESSDPNNYGKLYFREPPKGMAPKSIFQSLGLWDHFTPVPNIAAFALAMGVTPVEPRLYDLPYLSLTDLRWKNGKVAGNVADGKATAVLKQYVAPPRDDGHFVIFDLWAARHDWSRFLASLAQGGLSVLE
ncbi:MAG TPA: hypothetical protein PKL17_04835 [Pseudomonadota bacterium]|nr:hypothetical protein [Pseudomonadota bacterium]